MAETDGLGTVVESWNKLKKKMTCNAYSKGRYKYYKTVRKNGNLKKLV